MFRRKKAIERLFYAEYIGGCPYPLAYSPFAEKYVYKGEAKIGGTVQDQNGHTLIVEKECDDKDIARMLTNADDGVYTIVTDFTVDLRPKGVTSEFVEVVRCKECKYYQDGCCPAFGWKPDPTDFCSRGERK